MQKLSTEMAADVVTNTCVISEGVAVHFDDPKFLVKSLGIYGKELLEVYLVKVRQELMAEVSIERKLSDRDLMQAFLVRDLDRDFSTNKTLNYKRIRILSAVAEQLEIALDKEVDTEDCDQKLLTLLLKSLNVLISNEAHLKADYSKISLFSRCASAIQTILSQRE